MTPKPDATGNHDQTQPTSSCFLASHWPALPTSTQQTPDLEYVLVCRLLVILLLLTSLSLRDGLGNPCRRLLESKNITHNSQGKRTVKITLALLSDAAATLLLILLNNLDLLEGLQDLAVDAAASIDVLRGTSAPVLGAAVDLAKAANTVFLR
jgi:hypothetical protein